MKHLSFILFILTISFSSCKKKAIEQENDFDKGALLIQVSDNIILPRYQQVQDALNDLNMNWINFKNVPNSANLSLLQNSWLTANLRFQGVKVFNFGPALTNGLNSSFATFPCDTSKVLANASNGNANLSTLSNLDAIGFPALEYLFYRNGALTSLSNESELRTYVDAIFGKMISELNQVINAWSNGYSATFKNSTGTETTSGFSLLINAFNQDFELAKNAKLGIPMGKQSLGIPQLNYEEAPFSKKSLLLLNENLKAIYDLYTGTNLNGQNDFGFDDYLIALDKNQTHTSISSRFNSSFSFLDQLSDDLSFEVNNNETLLDDLYLNLQSTVVLLKTDMTSAFGVLITYQDNDGD